MIFPKVLLLLYGQILPLTLFVESHPNYTRYSRLLSDGWIPGRKVVCI
jgi:hypothetical protein